MKTRDKILRKSQELFNARGERNVTTNHIAAELGISDDVALPGFTPNPFASMARARVFVVSSRWEIGRAHV